MITKPGTVLTKQTIILAIQKKSSDIYTKLLCLKISLSGFLRVVIGGGGDDIAGKINIGEKRSMRNEIINIKEKVTKNYYLVILGDRAVIINGYEDPAVTF